MSMAPAFALAVLLVRPAGRRPRGAGAGVVAGEAQPASPTTHHGHRAGAGAGLRPHRRPASAGRSPSSARTQQGQMLDAGMSVKAGDVLFRLDETTFRNAVAAGRGRR